MILVDDDGWLMIGDCLLVMMTVDASVVVKRATMATTPATPTMPMMPISPMMPTDDGGNDTGHGEDAELLGVCACPLILQVRAGVWIRCETFYARYPFRLAGFIEAAVASEQ